MQSMTHVLIVHFDEHAAASPTPWHWGPDRTGPAPYETGESNRTNNDYDASLSITKTPLDG